MTKIVLAKDIGRGLAIGTFDGANHLNVYISNDQNNVLNFGTDDGLFVAHIIHQDIIDALEYDPGTVFRVGGTGNVSGLTLTGEVTQDGDLTLGGTLVVLPSNFESQSQKLVLASPNTASGKPTFRALVPSDVPTLNQDTTGQAGKVAHLLQFGLGLTGQGLDLFTRDTFDGSEQVQIDLDNYYGDTKNPYGSKTQHWVLAAPVDSNGVPTFRALLPSDIPTLNQNTTGSAAKLTTARKINGVNFDGTGDITISAVDTVTPRIAVSEKGQALGVATLDASGTVPAAQLPSYVDDVLEFANVAAFPATGETGKIYVARNSGTAADPSRQYRWSGTVYVEIEPSPGSTDAVPEGSTNKYFTDARALTAVTPYVDTKTTTEVNNAAALAKDVIGFPTRTTSTLSFNDATRTLTLTPVGTLYVYKWNVKYTITTARTLVIANTTGGRYIKYNPASDALEEISGNPIFSDDILVAYVYWDAVSGWAPIFADERHSTARDTQWHKTQHTDIGAVWRSGGTLSYTLNSDTAVNLGVSTPLALIDEDLEHNIVDGTGSGDYVQVLATNAQLPCLYLNGTGYKEVAFSTIPWIRNGNGAQYNPIVAGVGSLADVPLNSYFAYWVVATNDIRSPVKVILGRNTYSNSNLAEAETFDAYGLPLPEFVPMYKVVLHKKSTNTGNAALVNIESVVLLTGRQVSLSSSFSATSHNSLTDRSLDNQHPISSITGLQAKLDTWSNVDNTHDADKSVYAATKWTKPRSVTYSGDASGTFTIDGSANVVGVALTLASTGVTPNSGYTKFTVDGKGRITAAGYISSSDVTIALGYTPYNDWSFSGLATGQIMLYNATSGRWENKPQSALSYATLDDAVALAIAL